jgi:hypothetical protein
MASARRLAVGLGALVVLVFVVAAVAVHAWADRKLNEVPRIWLAQAEPGWMVVFQNANRLPEVATLGAARSSDGDGSAIFYTAAMTWRSSRARDRQATAADSAAWQAAAHDSTLDRVVAAAQFRAWDGYARAMPQRRSTDLYSLQPPPYAPTNVALQGLRIRAEERLARRDLAGARADLGALVALGEQMLRHEPTSTGMGIGGQAIRLALAPYADLARATRDTSAAAHVRRLEAWAGVQPVLGTVPGLYYAVPDSAFKMAVYTSLALGWRRFALVAFLTAHLLRPSAVVLGFPGSALDTLRSLTRDANPDFARVASVAVRTVEQTNRATIARRWWLARTWSQLFPL